MWILNPSGVLFAKGSSVAVAGLLVTTHAITDANFMAGKYQFTAVPGVELSKIINHGTITVADTGMVALVAPGVENNGLIQANMGKVALASGTAFVLDMYGDGLINFGNSAPANSGYVKNAGKIVANGGKVYLTANSAAQAVDSVINVSGVVEARSVGSHHGVIVLNGGHHGKVKVSAKLNTSNVDPNENGGFIETSGETLDIALGAVNPGKGGAWSIDPTTIIVDTNISNGDWVDQIQNSIAAGFSISLSADTILVMDPITAVGVCGFNCYPMLSLSANTLLDILANVTLTFANMNFYSSNVLQTSSAATLSVTNGTLALTGLTLLEVDGPVNITNGSLSFYSDLNITTNNTLTALNGSMLLLAGYGNIVVNGEINGTNQDDIQIFAANNITLNAPITTNNAHLDIEAGYCYDGCNYGDLAITEAGSITATNNSVYLSASNSVEIDGSITIHGGNLEVYAQGYDYGQISINAPILLDTSVDGDMYIWAWSEIDINNTITLTDGGFEAIAVFGDVNVYSNISASNYLNLYAYDNVYSEGSLTVTDGSLNVEAGYCYSVCSNYGHVTLNAPVSVTDGDAYIYAPNSITTNDTVIVSNGGVEFDTSYYSIHINGEVNVSGDHNAYFEAYAGGSVHIDAPIKVMNSDSYFCGDYAVDIEAGQEYGWGKIYSNSPLMLNGGDAYLYAASNIYINTTEPLMADGNIYFESPVLLGTDVTVTSSSGNVYFDRVVDTSWSADPASLMINVLNGFVKFRNNVGDNNPLNNLIINGMTKFCNWCSEIVVVTWLSQIYNGPVMANTDVVLVTLENGATIFDHGYSAPYNGLILVSGVYGNTDAYVHGNNIDVGFLIFAGAGSVDLFNTTVDGVSGSDTFAQVDIEGYGNHYCVNGVGLGLCFIPPTNNDVVQGQHFTQPSLPLNNSVWNYTVTDANGNPIEVCDEKGCTMDIVKNP